MTNPLVLDCSVAAKWVLPEPGHAEALRLLDQYASGEVSLLAPDILLTEFASLLAKRTRRKQISPEQARSALHLMRECAPRLFETKPLVPRALDIALEYQLSLWDAIYLALAAERDCALVTADHRQFRANAARHPSIRFLR